MVRTVVAAIAVGALVGGACSEPPEDKPRSSGDAQSFEGPVPSDAKAYPLVVSSEIVVGSNRFLIGLLNDEDAPIGSPEIDVEARFFNLDESSQEPVSEAQLSYLESIPGERGLYVGTVEFDAAGKWGAEVDISGDGLDETVRTSFEVKEEPSTPEIGAPAPDSETPTADDVKKLSEITTDAHPDPAFYKLSVDEAIERREPFVVVFATPKFCSSAVCGPTLNVVKEVSEDHAGLTFIHVEVYSNLDDPSNLKLVRSVKEWGLPTEPWVFVVDERGRVAAKYEGTVGPDELDAELEKL
ncbi:MAG: TlpA family protein disulfide reductase [Actinomycetota bacterium]